MAKAAKSLKNMISQVEVIETKAAKACQTENVYKGFTWNEMGEYLEAMFEAFGEDNFRKGVIVRRLSWDTTGVRVKMHMPSAPNGTAALAFTVKLGGYRCGRLMNGPLFTSARRDMTQCDGFFSIRMKTTSGRGKRPDYSATPTVRRQNRIPSLDRFSQGCKRVAPEFPFGIMYSRMVITVVLVKYWRDRSAELGLQIWNRQEGVPAQDLARSWNLLLTREHELVTIGSIPDLMNRAASGGRNTRLPGRFWKGVFLGFQNSLVLWLTHICGRGEGLEEMFKPDESSTAGNTRGVCGIWHKAIHLTFLNPQTDSKMRVLIRGVGG
ncbi:hypothetical protein C8R43DRAFT_955093 [Mycena crocata]|nr:hypothetical protein C8R43DRAFT_955093 [Mycena crocata]